MGPKLRGIIAKAFHDDVFRPHFGKTFDQLTAKDKKSVQSEIEDCFADNGFVRYFMSPPFEHREKWQRAKVHQEWMAAIDEVRSAPPPPPPPPAALPAEPGERALHLPLGPGKKVLSTPLYRVHLGLCKMHVVIKDRATPLGENLRQLAIEQLIPMLAQEPVCFSGERLSGTIEFYYEATAFAIYSLDGVQHGREGRGLRVHEGPGKPSSGRELPVLQLYFHGPAEGPYRFKTTYIDQLAFDYDIYYEGDPSLDSLDRILAFVADPEAISPAAAEIVASRAAAREERRLEASVRQREQREAEARAQRKEAAPVLAFLEGVPNPPPAYDFGRFANARLLTDVYTGNFEPLTGKHSPEDPMSFAVAAASALGAMVGNRNWRAEQQKMEANLAQIQDYANRRTPVQLAFKAYHEAFAEVCRSSTSRSPWTTLTFQRSLVERDRYGTELSRRDLGSETVAIRQVYAEAFGEAYEFADDPGFFALAAVPSGLSSLSRSLEQDFTRLLQADGCDSPVTRSIEVNLYLAYRWLMPAQQLR